MGLPETPWPPTADGEDDDQGVPSPDPSAVFPALCPAEDALSSTYKDTVQETTAAGVCGLRNLGNTCFMNAGLQCLLSNIQLLGFLLSLPADWPASETTRSPPFLARSSQPQESLLVWQLAQLARQVWSGRFVALKPVAFKDALGRACPQFNDYRQHDCQEFLTLLLDTLHEQTNLSKSANGILLPSTQTSLRQDRGMHRSASRSIASKYLEARESTVSNEEDPDIQPYQSCRLESLEGTVPLSNGDLEKPNTEDNAGPAAKKFKSDTDSGDRLSAEESWEKYEAANRSVVVDTFQGQLQSKVVCSECGHVSLTYEPFMYLPVPLPHAMEIRVSVTYVPLKGPRLRCQVQVGRVGRVGDLYGSLLSLLDPEDVPLCGVVLAHVSVEDNVIERFLEDHLPVRYLEGGGRLVYAFELGPTSLQPLPPTCASHSGNTWHSCVICLEDKADDELRTHLNCGAHLCNPCVEVTCEHYGNNALICPVCKMALFGPQEFVPLTSEDPGSKDRPILVSVLLSGSDSNLRAPEWRVPAVVTVPRCTSYDALQAAAAALLPEGTNFTLSLLDTRGRRCGRCSYAAQCKGCPVESGLHVLLPSDCLGVQCEGEAPILRFHPSLEGGEIPGPLSLSDCIRAFCESETLDEDNHWLCPVCCCHRRARKTLSLWRLPKTLMVYLKRFVFQESYGSKLDAPVEFPLEGLDLGPFVRGPFGSQEGNHVYDLHAFVCHFGGVNSGHYTAYARHSILGRWFHYDDETTGSLIPTAGDCQHAYVLFYQQKDPSNGGEKGSTSSPLENVDSMDSTPGSATLGLHLDTFQNILRHLEDCPPLPSSSL